MKKFRKILLSQNSLAKSLGVVSYFNATKFDHHTEILKNINAKSALVLAPHPDDDVFGLGGTLSILAKNRTNVSVAYFCDGALGDLDGKERNPELIEIRKKEAKKAGEILGFDNLTFFGYMDGKLSSGTSVVRALQDLIIKTKPDIIFVPSFLDNHPDHRATNAILINALNSSTTLTVKEIWSYEIWTVIFPNRIVDITDNIELKKKAMGAHVSQLKSRGYDKAILGLNQYRAEINNLSGYAEGFFATTPEIYRKLYRRS
jgi:LmbE family N-acetylglucosaminyl deacetylase